eukprot:TRINITY_DN9935_c0_g1_i1.p1 TRINITY_DN9935_c0_g1~~TRINITY_DN9935_c0_g1_i1.p1  ORF type:complete len:179 (+),score=29.97 TRINITY_DN9935_c0_g1_i1:72-539(+)
MSEEEEKRVVDGYHKPEEISITVTDPQTVEQNGKNLYTTYLISTETNFPQFKKGEFSVRRRYSDFVWLRERLKDTVEKSRKGKSKGGSIPLLPGNTLSSFLGPGRFDPDFIKDRRAGLAKFINSVANHVICRFDTGLHSFLQDSDDDWQKTKEGS